MKKKRLKNWPHWKRTNAGLFLIGLAAYVGLYALLCLANPRIVFMTLTILAACSTFTLLWITINHKDQHETD